MKGLEGIGELKRAMLRADGKVEQIMRDDYLFIVLTVSY